MWCEKGEMIHVVHKQLMHTTKAGDIRPPRASSKSRLMISALAEEYTQNILLDSSLNELFDDVVFDDNLNMQIGCAELPPAPLLFVLGLCGESFKW